MLINDEMDKLLMIPGPTPVQREILRAIGEPTISHTSRQLADIILECRQSISRIAGTSAGQTFLFGGSGTLAQEAAVVNLVAPGERLLVASNGLFSDRFAAIGEAYGMRVERLAAPWGTSVTPEMLAEGLKREPARAVTITQVETSTGVLAPVAELAAVARDAGAFVVVDAVCALGGIPTEMDGSGLDIVLSGAQKALGVPPGLTILVVSPRALERRRALQRVPAYYADLLNWQASMDDPTVYFSTHAVNMFYALRAALTLIENEGLPARFRRHEVLADAFRAGMRALGFGSLTTADYRAPTLSVLSYPEGVDDERFRSAMGGNGIVAAGCLGAFKGRGARFGHMGNITADEILRTVAAAENSLRDIRGADATADAGHGVAAAQKAYHSSLPSPALIH